MRVRNPPFRPFIFGSFIPNILDDLRLEVLRREVLRLEVLRAPLRPELRLRVAHPFFAARERFALEVRRLLGLVVVLRALRRVAGLRLEDLRLLAPRFAARLLLEALRRRVAHAFFAARERFALEVVDRVVLRLEELRFAVLRLFLFLVAAAFLAAADRLRLLAALVRAAFLAAADRFAFVEVRFAVLRRATVFLPDFLVVLAILDTFFLALRPPLGGFTNVRVPSAIMQSHVRHPYKQKRHRLA